MATIAALLLGLVGSATMSIATVPFVAVEVAEGRQGYGGGGYGGGGMSISSYGGGCPSCPPYVHCDGKLDGLLAFGVGALLGLLLAALRAQMMMMMAPAPAPMMMMPAMMMGRRGHDDQEQDEFEAAFEEFNELATNGKHGRRSSSLLHLLHLPEDTGDDLAPVLADALRLFTSSSADRCLERWLCQLHHEGGLEARIASFSSIVFGWYTKGWSGGGQKNIFSALDVEDCALLSPHCNVSLADQQKR